MLGMNFFLFTMQHSANKFRKLDELVGKPSTDEDIPPAGLSYILKSARDSLLPRRPSTSKTGEKDQYVLNATKHLTLRLEM